MEKHPNSQIMSKERGCCTKCAQAEGYFSDRYSEWAFWQINQLKYRYNFTKKFGFFDNTNKCCKLPRNMRSHTCTAFGKDCVEHETVRRVISTVVSLYVTAKDELKEVI